MENTIFIDKSYIVASTLNVKIKQLKEDYVTKEEVNYVSNEIQKILNEQNLNAIITDNIDSQYFEVSNVISINKSNGLSLESIINRYQGYLGLDILTLIWNENNIMSYLKTLDEEPCNFTILPSNRMIVVSKEKLLEAKKVKPAPEVLALMQELGMNFWGSTDDQTNESDVDQTFDMMAVPCDRAFVVAPEKAEEFINRKPNSEIRQQNSGNLNIDNSEVECEVVALPSNRMVVISKEQLLEAEKVTPAPEVLALLRCWGSDDEQINETDIVQNLDEQGPVLTKKKENKCV